MELTKECLLCWKTFIKPVNESLKNWNDRHKFCSKECHNSYMRWRQNPSDIKFKKWRTPWNKWLKWYKAWELNNKWKGWVTPENEKFRKSQEYKYWRRSVFERDRFTCQHCLVKWVKIQAHHIKSFSKFPEERLNIDNWITLCFNCHKNIHANMNFKEDTLN